MADPTEKAGPKMMRVFLLKTYCDANGKRHAKNTFCSLPEKEIMGKHPSSGKNLIKMQVVKREDDYDEDTDPKVLGDEDNRGSAEDDLVG